MTFIKNFPEQRVVILKDNYHNSIYEAVIINGLLKNHNENSLNQDEVSLPFSEIPVRAY